MVTGLVGAVAKLWNKITSILGEHNAERKEWVEAMKQMVKQQSDALKNVNENHDRALKELADKYDKRQGEINETMLNAFKTAFNNKK